jgi:hypothetical protein
VGRLHGTLLNELGVRQRGTDAYSLPEAEIGRMYTFLGVRMCFGVGALGMAVDVVGVDFKC